MGGSQEDPHLLDNFAFEYIYIRMGIMRDTKDLIRELGKQFLIVNAIGSRQVGKTNILYHLFSHILLCHIG